MGCTYGLVPSVSRTSADTKITFGDTVYVGVRGRPPRGLRGQVTLRVVSTNFRQGQPPLNRHNFIIIIINKFLNETMWILRTQ